MTDSAGDSSSRTTGGSPSAADPFAAWRQLLEGMTGSLGSISTLTQPTDPMTALKQLTETLSTVGGPTAVFITQLEATAATLKERREQVRALIDQLTLFDEQLALFDASLAPVLEWSRTWVRVQESVFDPLGLTKRRDKPPSGRP